MKPFELIYSNHNGLDGEEGVSFLLTLSRRAMLSYGLEPDFSAEAIQELEGIESSAQIEVESFPDLTALLWCSIDNDTSMDLDQITVAELLPEGRVMIRIGVADVDAVVKQDGPLDQHAKKNTTSVYTGVTTFPMLPEKLSENLTSLVEGEARLAVVIEMVIDEVGNVESERIFRAVVKNQAKLAYTSVSEWLEARGTLPDKVACVEGLEDQLRIQDCVAQKMRKLRYKHGALDLETIEPRAEVKDGQVIDLKYEVKNRARELIEDFMIAANGVTARYLSQAGYPILRRVVRSPERWARIVEVAQQFGEQLPTQPDSKALGDFLVRRREADLLRFPDLSLTIVKLLGRGEYVLELPGESVSGHFGLAVQDYSHSTAPNRRFPDIITQRILKAALMKRICPYDTKTLNWLASHCTLQENAAEKVERLMRKSASALFLSSRIGEKFEAIVTGASNLGTWVRVLDPPVEGKLMHLEYRLDVGDRIRVKLVSVNVVRGFIDFVCLH